MANNQTNQDKKKRGMTVSEAGHKGGETTSRKYGPDFYEKIGHKGGQKVQDLVEKGKKTEKSQ